MQQFEHKDTNLCNYSPVTSFKITIKLFSFQAFDKENRMCHGVSASTSFKITIKLFSFQAFDKENRMCHGVSASTSLLYPLPNLNISLNIFLKSGFYLE